MQSGIGDHVLVLQSIVVPEREEMAPVAAVWVSAAATHRKRAAEPFPSGLADFGIETVLGHLEDTEGMTIIDRLVERERRIQCGAPPLQKSVWVVDVHVAHAFKALEPDNAYPVAEPGRADLPKQGPTTLVWLFGHIDRLEDGEVSGIATVVPLTGAR